MPDEKHEYLGDGVYASFDGWRIWLRTGSHDSIALDPSVYASLVRYHAKLSKAAAEPTNTEEDE